MSKREVQIFYSKSWNQVNVPLFRLRNVRVDCISNEKCVNHMPLVVNEMKYSSREFKSLSRSKYNGEIQLNLYFYRIMNETQLEFSFSYSRINCISYEIFNYYYVVITSTLLIWKQLPLCYLPLINLSVVLNIGKKTVLQVRVTCTIWDAAVHEFGN